MYMQALGQWEALAAGAIAGAAGSQGGGGGATGGSGGGGTQATQQTKAESTAQSSQKLTANIQVSPQISPQFIQQFQPSGSGVNAGVSMTPTGMPTLNTAAMPWETATPPLNQIPMPASAGIGFDFNQYKWPILIGLGLVAYLLIGKRRGGAGYVPS